MPRASIGSNPPRPLCPDAIRTPFDDESRGECATTTHVQPRQSAFCWDGWTARATITDVARLARRTAHVGLLLIGSTAACASDNPLFGLERDATGGTPTERTNGGLDSDADETADSADSADADDGGNDNSDADSADDDNDDDDTGNKPGCVTIGLWAAEDAFVVGNNAGRGGSCEGETCLNNYGYTDRRAVFEDGTGASYLLARFSTNQLEDLDEVNDVRVAVQLG